MAISTVGLSAQQFSASAVFDSSSFLSKESQVFVSSYSFSSAILAHFEISNDTNCHQFPYTELDKMGFTRTELIAAAIISKEKGANLCLVLEEFKKDGSFRKISQKNGFDPVELFSKAGREKQEIEKKAADEVESMRKVWLSTEPFNNYYEE